ncbi:hypothetical protein AB1Y20_005878 [Prymnesium parvum]|uniref:Uncharacterized protein n=1 Tax=Prymnesium parvum TaxID=97485 RepID=A0AB34J123_PRYPA
MSVAAVAVCWVAPAALFLALRADMTPEKLLFNVIGPVFLALPALALRLLISALRRLSPPPLPAFDSTPLAEQLAANWDARSGGFRAGVGVYASVWTRDSFFALFAPVGPRAVRLRALCDRLRRHRAAVRRAGPYGYARAEASGARYAHVPFQFNEVWYIPSTLRGRACMRRRPVVLHCDEKYGQPVMDVNAQYVIMVSEAFSASPDCEWLAEHAEALAQALAFYELYADVQGLVHEKPFGNWEDSLLYCGPRPFTNLMYLEALRRAAALLRALGRTPDARKYEAEAERIYEPVMRLISAQRDTKTVALAGLWLVDEPRVELWMREMLRMYPNTMPPNRWPVPPPSACCSTLRIIGQAGYHRDFRWSNVGCLWAAALVRRGFINEGRAVFDRFEKAVERFGTVHEVYEAETELPVCRSLYRSETRFSMGIGPYLYAKHIIHGPSDAGT